MKNIDAEIIEMRKTIDFKRNLLNRLTLDGRLEPLTIESAKEEIRKLERKLVILEEKKKMGKYVPKEPRLGDDRYVSCEDKVALDILRVLYYEYFHKDPNLSFVMKKAMFDDNTLPIIARIYLVRGEFPFKLMLTTNYQDYSPNEEWSVGIRFDRKDLVRECAKEYLSLFSTLIKRYTNNEINFICGDWFGKSCTLAYMGDGDFFHYSDHLRRKMYYEFFELLCDNNIRNIIYIGDTMKRNAKPEEIEKVNLDFVNFHAELITRHFGISMEEFMKANEELKSQVLTLKREL